jgi:phosphate transport system protein
VNTDEKSIDSLVLSILARWQPVASDLRLLTAIFRLTTDLERVSDEAVGIAKATAQGGPPAQMKLDRLRKMGSDTQQIVRDAVLSFLKQDEALATRVREQDAEIGSLYRDTIADVVGFASGHGDAAAKCWAAMNVARCLERIADHAANIAEGTHFVVRDQRMPR